MMVECVLGSLFCCVDFVFVFFFLGLDVDACFSDRVSVCWIFSSVNKDPPA